jgi:hypothetical protein
VGALTRRNAIAVAAVVLGGCLGTSPLDEAADALGPEPGGEPGPEHRPGQPCLACHSEDSDRGEEIFALAGTVYETTTSPTGLEGAEVSVSDSGGHGFVVRTNRAGNFYVREGEEEDGEGRGRGGIELPYRLVFPLFVMVRGVGESQVMATPVEREGSCAYCHTREPGARSNGQIYVREPIP